MFFDEDKLIVQTDCDGGDTAQREGWAWFGKRICEERLGIANAISLPASFEDTLKKLEVGTTGRFRRHPTQVAHSSPDAFSRDQMTPLIAAMGAWRSDRSQVEAMTARLKRSRDSLSVCPDPAPFQCLAGTKDVIGADILNLYHRALAEPLNSGDELNNPLHLNGDVILLAGTLVRLFQARQKPDDVGDDLNLIVQLVMAKLYQPSDTGNLAISTYVGGVGNNAQKIADVITKNLPNPEVERLFSKIGLDAKIIPPLLNLILVKFLSVGIPPGRPRCSGSYLLRYRAENPGGAVDEATVRSQIEVGYQAAGWQPECSNIFGVLRWYFRLESNGNPALAELYGPITDAYLLPAH